MSNIAYIDKRGRNKPRPAQPRAEPILGDQPLTPEQQALIEATRPWIGVDLDGTLAIYPHGKEDPWAVGDPILRMVRRVQQWLELEQKVKIVTARVSIDDPEVLAHNIEQINEFSRNHFGVELEITCKKDMFMIALWDDRAVTVLRNSGIAMVLDG